MDDRYAEGVASFSPEVRRAARALGRLRKIEWTIVTPKALHPSAQGSPR
jgi:hypothetical protein